VPGDRDDDCRERLVDALIATIELLGAIIDLAAAS
jgi:hypothetical protein